MKIGIDVREFERDKMTGIGRYLLNFLRWAAKEKQDTEFFLYGNQHTEFPVKAQNFKEQVIPEKITFFWDQILLPFHLRKDNIDILFSPYYKAPIYSPCPSYIVIHDLLFLKLYEDTFRKKIKNILFLIIARRIARKAKKVIPVSFYSKSEIWKYLRINNKKIEVIYNMVGGQFFPEPVPGEIERVRKKFNTGEYYLLYVGNFKKHKNIENLIIAFEIFQSGYNFNDYKLILGGAKDANSSRIEKKIKELNIKHKVLFTGLLDDRDMRPLYSGAALFAYPSLYEGSGLPIIEAMACGTPVICSNRTSMPEITGDAALLFDPENMEEISNALKEVTGNSKTRNNLIQKGLKRVKEINKTKFAERVYDILISSTSVVNDSKNGY